MSNTLRVRQSDLVGVMESAVIVATGTTDTLKGHAFLRPRDDGGAEILVSNGQTVARLPIRGATRDSDQGFTFPARYLGQLLKLIDANAEVELTHTTEDESVLVTINGKKTGKTVLRSLDIDEFGVFDKKLAEVDAKGWNTFSLSRLLSGMQFVRDFISDDKEQKDLNMAACEGEVLKASNINVYAMVKFGGLNASFNIPRHEVAGFVNFLQRHKENAADEVEIGHAKSMTFFRIGEDVFGFARIAAAFPKIKASIDPTDEETDHWMIDVKVTQETLQKVGVGQKLDETYTDVQITDEVITFTSDSEVNKRTNQWDADVRETIAGGEEPVTFSIRRENLRDAVGRMSSNRNISMRVKHEGRGHYVRLTDKRPVGKDKDGEDVFDTYHALIPIRPLGHRDL